MIGARNWQVELACLNAWPAARQMLHAGWLLRMDGGTSRRLNSANLLSPDALCDQAALEAIQGFYACRRLRPIFRVTELARDIDDLLAQQGYVAEAHTHTLWAPLANLRGNDGGAVTDIPAESWLTAHDRMSAADPESSARYRTTLANIVLQCGFARAEEQGEIKAVAYGALQGDLLIVESVLTDPSARNRGFARTCLGNLFAWAGNRGATAAALQVMADNEPALALYRGLGFNCRLYDYHYRLGPAAEAD